ncbi:hypothetical protein ACFL3T_02010 [Patescibacteria group bacterium]
MGRHIGKILQFFGLLLLFVINQQNISAFYQEDFENQLAEQVPETYNNHAASNDEHYANQLDSLNLRLYPGSTYKTESRSTLGSLNHCKSLVFQTLTSLPEEHREYLQHLTLYFAEGRRGLGGGSTIILRCSNIDDMALSSVLVHEMGHVVDTGLKTGNSWTGKSEFMDGSVPIYNDDPSLRFYRISWLDEKTIKPEAERQDFVTGYGMTDPYEDFAESYNYYLLHGKQFKEMAKYDKELRRKYLYLKYFIFSGQEFDNDQSELPNFIMRRYDSTVLAYDHEKFLRSNNNRQEIATL